MGTIKLKGFFLAIVASLFWGISGTFAQFLFQERDISPEWLVTVRLIVSGLVLLGYSIVRNPKAILGPWKESRSIWTLLAFGIFGMLSVQYTYFAAIKHSNAATATILQYLGPIFIAIYYSIIQRKLPSSKELLAICLALIGTFLIVTHGSLESLSITGTALFWGISSAVALAAYSILPIDLMKRNEASVVVGWGMLIGGAAFSFVHSPFDVPGTWDNLSYFYTFGIILFGTTLAFFAYLVSVKLIGATVASLLSCAEPLSAAVIAVIWLKVNFGFYDWIGTSCIILTIIFLTLNEKVNAENV